MRSSAFSRRTVLRAALVTACLPAAITLAPTPAHASTDRSVKPAPRPTAGSARPHRTLIGVI